MPDATKTVMFDPTGANLTVSVYTPNNRIRWDRKLHEKIIGHTQYAFLPPNEDLSLYHDKTIETQIKTNLRYNEQFTVQDNLGHKII